MRIQRRVTGPLETNVWLITEGEEGLLIDAADDPLAILDLVGDTPVTHLVTTHAHHDHLGALTDIATHSGARLVAGMGDADAIETATGVRIDDRVWDGDRFALGNLTVSVIGLVGHTPGGIALAISPPDSPTRLFVGDSLFPGGIGRTTSTDAFNSLIDDVTTKLFGCYDDTTEVYPGHGDSTTLGAERPHLIEWRARGW
ncbi:MAG: MBL fold metallo-hydrolase [Propioniciclava sp.]